MALVDILDIVVSEIGLHAVNDRSQALRYINMAAKTIFEMDDYDGSLKETVVAVQPGQQIALADTIGELRAVRQHTLGYKVEVTPIQDRYGYSKWMNPWTSWRIKGTSALMVDITNASILHLTTQRIENAVVTISGKTSISNRISEIITLDAYTEISVNAYEEIYSIQRSIRGNYDITIKDAQGTTLAVLRNDQTETRYLIVDLTAYPFIITGDPVYVEVLYKMPFSKLTNDSDKFPCEGFDDAIAMMAIADYYKQQDDGNKKSHTYHVRSLQLIANVARNKEAGTQKTLTFAPNVYQDLYTRYPLSMRNS